MLESIDFVEEEKKASNPVRGGVSNRSSGTIESMKMSIFTLVLSPKDVAVNGKGIRLAYQKGMFCKVPAATPDHAQVRRSC